MTNEQIIKAILLDDIDTLKDLAGDSIPFNQPQLSNKEIKENLLWMLPKKHPNFMGNLQEYIHRHETSSQTR
jgi:hypothetical protein